MSSRQRITYCKNPNAFLLGWAIILALVISSCDEEEKFADRAFTFESPVNFPPAVYTFENNPLTREGFELGRMLFYDPMLSSDGTVSCGSCHQPFKAFADPVHALSVGVENRVGTRNATPLFNLAFQRFFFWDGGVNHLDFVPINPIENEVEMGESLGSVVQKLNNSEYYSAQFKNVFGRDMIDSRQMLHALSQFMLMLVSDDSPYDRFVRKEGYELTSKEREGLQLFQQKCADCHATDLFTDGGFRNSGLDAEFSKDSGRFRITELKEDLGKFKVPSLRNLELTGPYMHDGRLKTLRDVLDHYDEGVQWSETLDPLLQQNGELGIPMEENEKDAIIAFLHSLTDRSFARDTLFYDPF